jgi:hypothetical protein
MILFSRALCRRGTAVQTLAHWNSVQGSFALDIATHLTGCAPMQNGRLSTAHMRIPASAVLFLGALAFAHCCLQLLSGEELLLHNVKFTLVTVSLSSIFYSRQGDFPPKDILLPSPFHACVALATSPAFSTCMHMHPESTTRVSCTNMPCTYLALTQCLACRDGIATLSALALSTAAASNDSRALLVVEAVGGILPCKCSAAILRIIHVASCKDIVVRDHIHKSRRLYRESGAL